MERTRKALDTAGRGSEVGGKVSDGAKRALERTEKHSGEGGIKM